MQAVTRIFSLCGPPGSGKGTLASRCQKNFDMAFLSVGDLCRKHIALEDELGKIFIEYMHRGMLVPDQFIIKMVQEWVKKVLALECICLQARREFQTRLFGAESIL